MTEHQSFSRSKSPAPWQRLLIGLMAVLALGLQGGAALAHTHGPSGISTPDLVVVWDDTGRIGSGVELPAQPVPGEQAAKCPLCHSSLSHGGVLSHIDAVSIGEIQYAAYHGVSFSRLPQQAFTFQLPPLRGPPNSI